jgi:guanylate kinase
MNNQGIIFILSAPSGGGKSTVARRLIAMNQDLWLSVSVTTRPKRENEVDGKDYYFIDQSSYQKMQSEGQLLESAKIYDNYYGIPKAKIVEKLDQGIDVLFDIDWQGARVIKSLTQFLVVSIFILPPSLQELQNRLIKRGDKPEIISTRMLYAKEECYHSSEYDYVLVNNNLEETVDNVNKILFVSRLGLKKDLQHKLISSPQFSDYPKIF